MYRLKSNNGKTSVMLKAGSDLVRNELPTTAAQKILDEGTVESSSVPGFIHVGEWYLEGEEIIEKEHTVKNGKVGKH